MPRIRIKQDDQKQRKSVSEAQKIFLMHCKLKNLAPYTIKYYEENLNFFQSSNPQTKNVDEITQDVIDSYSSMLMGKGDRITAINARLRALFVFLRFSFNKGWAENYPLSQLKEDEYAKEPYSDTEMKKLLERPTSGNWAEWRSWAVINLLIATGIRASTVVNIKISDVDFEHSILYLRKLKNRKQQTLPISSSLDNALSLYLQMWEWNPEDYLFSGIHKEQLKPHSLESSIRRYNLSRGVSKTSVHLFRHTFAKNYILAGGSMVQLQAILGHSTLDMTRKYINLYGNDIQRDFDRLNPLNNILNKEHDSENHR